MIDKLKLESLYKKYNKRKFVSPDPLQFLYAYPDVADREIVAVIASSLAYGRVAQILKSVDKILNHLGDSPREFILASSQRTLSSVFSDFKHRFTTGDDMTMLLTGVRRVVKEYGSLNECFINGLKRSDTDIVPALSHFTEQLNFRGKHLLPSPEGGSACKRLNLYLRWMVRKDAVDPGGWHGVPKKKLLIPLDTHMAKIGRAIGFSARKSADLRMTCEITENFRTIQPDDPVKYDFALTRFGIRSDLDILQITNIL